MTTTMIPTGLRLPPAEFTELRTLYAEGYPGHRLSWNKWLSAVIRAGIAALKEGNEE